MKDEIQYLSENRVRAFGEVFFDIFHSGKVGDFSKIHFLAPSIRVKFQKIPVILISTGSLYDGGVGGWVGDTKYLR